MTPTFEAYIADYNYSAVRLSCLLCAGLFPAGVALDYMTHREFVGQFLLLRAGASLFALALLALSRWSALRRYSYLLIFALIMGCTLIMEVMVVKLEGAGSPYYAGLNLCTLGAGLVYVWTGRQALYTCLMILLIWAVPALYMKPDVYGLVFNNFYFLVSTAIIAVSANVARYNLARREYEARTALARASAELESSLERIRELDRLKSQFFANISHELRTPLTLITAPLQDLLHRETGGGTFGTAARATLEIILRNALRLHRLIDGLLDLARLEAGRLRLKVAPLDLCALLRSVVAAFQPAADTMGIALRLQIDLPGSAEAQALVVLGDSDKLEVVLTNLLGNAVKFTERGGHVAVRLQRGAGAEVHLSVSDDGPGIPLRDQPHIFERFRRVESPGRKQGGAGIGLALVKELVELHGGTVTVQSEPGRGAEFLVRLRTDRLAALQEAHAPSDDRASGEMPSAASVPMPRLSLDEIMPQGPALLHVNESLDSQRHQALMSGETTVTAPPPEVPLNSEPSGKRAQSGAHALRGEAQSGNAGEVSGISGIGDELRHRARVLVAEDNADLRRFLYDLLSEHYQVEVVADGRAALEAAQRHPPSLLLTDVMMPHLSGIELCHQLKSDPRTSSVPVILLTARGGVEETLEGFAHGADDYLVKPFNPRELQMRVAVQLKLRRLSAQVADAARLAAVGTLAAGVAHEIKNPLNAINTGAAALRRREAKEALSGKPTSGQGEVLDMIEECVARIADITTALTDHARPADGEGMTLCDLRQGVESTLRLLGERLRSANVDVVRDYRTTRQIIGRPRQLNQVFLNLLDNALRASPSGGHIHVTLAEVGGDRVALRVRDEGGGISLEDQDRIFDAFYTTRPTGEGTGLGLYLSRQIVDAHGGTIRLRSEPGKGAEFLVELPIQPAVALPLTRAVAEARS